MAMTPNQAVRICERGGTGVITMAGTAVAQSVYKAFTDTSDVTATLTGDVTATVSGAGFTNAQGKDLNFIVKITTAADTDIFKWSDDGGNTWTEGVKATGSAQTLSDGVTITLSASTGAAAGDCWEWTVSIPRNIKSITLGNTISGNGIYYYGFHDGITADTASTAGFPVVENGYATVEIDDLSKLYVLGGNSKVLHVLWAG